MSLQIRALAVRRGGRSIIEGLDAAPFEPGSLTAVLGPNGAGKSTLIQALAGLLASQGRVELEGQNLSTLAPLQRSHQVGLLPQSLPEATGLVAYELLLGGVLASGASRAEAEQRIEEVLDRLDLRSLAMARLDTLSGGQRQMMALAQVLARRPRLMLLDEPTSALDLYWQLAVLEAVREDARRRGSIVLMALHDLDLALRHCDRVLVLASGAKLADGAPSQVLTPELLARVYGIDARVETCSHGMPRLLVDGLLSPLQVRRPGPQSFNPAEPMFTAQSHISTERADAFLFKLCKHFGRKVPVQFDASQGEVQFEAGMCRMQSQDGQLLFACRAADWDSVLMLTRIIDGHVAMLMKQPDLTLDWQWAGGCAPAAAAASVPR